MRKDLIALTILVLAATAALVGCGPQQYSIVPIYCITEQAPGGALMKCPDGSQSFIADGTDGADGAQGPQGPQGNQGLAGEDGQDGTSVTLVELCSPARDLSEIAIKIGTSLVVTLSENANGKNTRLVKLRPGSYTTTDGYSCNFSINNNGEVIH
jgi:hypothetical protein